MTQEEKQLLVKDICAKIPFGLKCTTKGNSWQGVYPIRGYLDDKIFLDCPEYNEGDDEWLVQNIVPYLRPLTSMTKKEKKEYDKLRMSFYKNAKDASLVLIDWLNSHHFDHCGLIEKGLALEAPEDIYNS